MEKFCFRSELTSFIRVVELKVLSSEMDPAKISFIQKVAIKEWAAEFFRKIRPFPRVVTAL